MKILITGGSGFVGYRLCEKFAKEGHDVEYTYLKNDCKIENAKGHRVDITEANAVMGLAGKYDVIVHSAALANVDYCQKNPEEARAHNVEGTRNFAQLTKKIGALLVYVSTAHVFPASQKAYTENDVPEPEFAPSVYGRTKLEGEILVRQMGIGHLILRIDQPYYWNNEWQKDNTVTRTLKKLAKGEKVTEVEDWMNCPTFVPSFCDLALALVGMGAQGVFHACGPDYVSRLEWGKAVAREFGYAQERILEINSASLNLPVARPNVRLDSQRAYGIAKVKNASIAEGLRIMRREMEENQARR